MVVGGISPRARAYVRARATAVMQAQCRIERVSAPDFDEDDLTASAGEREVIYEGQCRLWESSGQGVIAVGDTDVVLQTTNLSIPWDSDPVPQRDDEFEIISSNTDSNLVGRRGVIMDSVKAGELRATRRFSVQMHQEKGDHG